MDRQSQWVFPNLDGEQVAQTKKKPIVSKPIIEQSTIDEARQRGYQEGLRQAEAESQQRLDKLSDAFKTLEATKLHIEQENQQAIFELIYQLVTTISMHAVIQPVVIKDLLSKADQHLQTIDGLYEIHAGTQIVKMIEKALESSPVKVITDPHIDEYSFRVESNVQTLMLDIRNSINELLKHDV